MARATIVLRVFVIMVYADNIIVMDRTVLVLMIAPVDSAIAKAHADM